MSSASAQHVTRRCRALRIATPSQIREMGLPELRKLKFLQPESLNAQASAGSANAIPDEVWNAYLYRCSLLRDEFLPGDVAKLFHVLGKLRPPFLLKKLRKRHSLIELGEDHDDEKLTGGGGGEGEVEKTQAEPAQFEKKSPPAALALVERSRVEDFAIYMLKNGSRRPDRYRMSDVALIYNACQKLHISSAVVEEYKKLLESCIFRRCNDKTHLKDLALLCHAFRPRVVGLEDPAPHRTYLVDDGEQGEAVQKRPEGEHLPLPAGDSNEVDALAELRAVCFQRVAESCWERIDDCKCGQTLTMLLHSFSAFLSTSTEKLCTNSKSTSEKDKQFPSFSSSIAAPAAVPTPITTTKMLHDKLIGRCVDNIPRFRGSDLVLFLRGMSLYRASYDAVPRTLLETHLVKHLFEISGQDFVHLIRLQEGAGGFAFTERFLKRFFKEVSYRVREFYPEKCAEIAVSQCVPAEVGQTMLRQLLQVVVGKRTKVVPQKQAGGGPGISSSNKIKHNDAGAETESGTDRHFAFERQYYENYDVKAYDKTRIVQILEPFVDNEQWLGDCLTRGRLATAVHQILKKS